VWLLDFLRLPLGIALVAHLWTAGTSRARVLAAALAGLLGGLSCSASPVYPPAALVAGIGIVLWRGLGRTPVRADWAVPTAVAAVGTAVVLNEALGVIVPVQMLARPDRWDQTLDFAERVMVWASLPGPAARLFVVGTVGTILWRIAYQPILIAAALAVHVAAFTGPRTEWAEREFLPMKADARFVHDYIMSRESPSRPTVYWPCGRIEAPWLARLPLLLRHISAQRERLSPGDSGRRPPPGAT
jgi:hypothetical protein